MSGRVAGKVALVTGGAKGLGEADARALAAEEAQVVLTDVDQEGGQSVADDIGAVFKHQDVTIEARWQTTPVSCCRALSKATPMHNTRHSLR